jgi:hydrogenase maturation protein HypF
MTGASEGVGQPAESSTLLRERVEVTGVVQGVGFRPFVHRLATELGLSGHVGNDSAKVFIEIAGSAEAIDRFARRLVDEAPPLARIVEVRRSTPVPDPGDEPVFRIVASTTADGARTLVPPDTAVCAECLAELYDPVDRRHHHPFITCTNCGPRFTIITDLPYDRPATTMAGFDLCDACRAEYRDPGDRRYHAQPIGCHDCGPRLWFEDRRSGRSGRDDADPIRAAAAVLADGGIVAIKGLGGYHLACDATDSRAVAELRRRKHRPDKPLAVMVAHLDQARRLAVIDRSEADLLASPAAPIVLVRVRPDRLLAAEVAPGNPLVGLMLPYTPVHHLLNAELDRPLVMTSANVSGEPLVSDRAGIDALAPLYDGLLDHDRPVASPCDDSVVRVMEDRLLPVRRARGYAPIPVVVPTGPPLLAVGAELKNTFCLAAGGRAWVSQHLGDMENLATLQALETTVERFTRLYDVVPERLVADAHPGYLSSGWARRRPEPVFDVQHHRAHVAAVVAEAGMVPTTRVVGFAFDGTGYGDDGTIWGGEVFAGPVTDLTRMAHLAPIPLPGGDAAIANPWRVALAHLHSAGIDWSGSRPARWADDDEVALLRAQLDGDVACVPTTSMGRLFDAVSSLIGLRHTVSYEAQAAIELEIAATEAEAVAAADPEPVIVETGHRYRFGLVRSDLDEPIVIDPGPVLVEIMADLGRRLPVGMIAQRFHQAVADVVAVVARTLVAESVSAERQVDAVVLSGGVFQNVLATRLCLDALGHVIDRSGRGIKLFTHHLVPPNDGGLALGQAYLGLHRALAEADPEHRQENQEH